MVLGILLVIIIVALLIFVPFLRLTLGALIRIAVVLFAIFIAMAGAAMLMNNETIYDRPGWKLRASRFMTMNYAATSEKGKGDAPCTAEGKAEEPKHEALAQAAEGRQARGKKKHQKEAAAEATPVPTAAPSPNAAEAEDENLYDELMTRNYICELDEPTPISREKLFQMAQDTIAQLRGWKVVSSDPRTGTINCLYTSRVFGFEDDIKLVVSPHADIAICSQSKIGEPGSTSPLRFLHGDFGANIGHIKEFYYTFKPRADQYCSELEKKQKPKQPEQ